MPSGAARGATHQRIADLSRSLHTSPQHAAGSVMQRMVDSAAEEVPGAQYAGVTLATRSRVKTPATSHRIPALLDAIQDDHRQGPCLDAAMHQDIVRVDDLEDERRWPLFRRDALRSTPVRSIMSFRLFVTSKTMGALNVYADRAHAFTAEAEEIGYVLATHAALAWDVVRRESQFQSALARRDIIGQAKGVLMAQFGIDAASAFEMLARLSQEMDVKIGEVARRVVLGRAAPDPNNGSVPE